MKWRIFRKVLPIAEFGKIVEVGHLDALFPVISITVLTENQLEAYADKKQKNLIAA